MSLRLSHQIMIGYATYNDFMIIFDDLGIYRYLNGILSP
jgi:hypothetical protein